MKHLVVGCENWNSGLILKTLKSNGELELIETDNFIGTFGTTVKTAMFSEEKETIGIILTIDNIDAVEYLMTVLKRSSTAIKFFRIIIVSSLLTWAGKTYSSEIAGASLESEFRKRVPIASVYEEYMLENSLFAFAKQYNAQLTIFSVGLVYGGTGFDLQDLFKNVWTAQPSFTLMSSHAENTVPIVHVNALETALRRQVESYNPEDGIFIPVVDSRGDKIQTIINGLNGFVNGVAPVVSPQATPTDSTPAAAASNLPSMAPSNAPSGSPSRLSSPRPATDLLSGADAATTAAPSAPQQYVVNASVAALVDKLMSDGPKTSFWGCDLPFQAHSSIVSPALMDNISIVWNEYLQQNDLTPLSVIMCGAPKVGKTETSKVVATELQIEHIDMFSALKFAYSLSAETIAALSPETYNLAAVSAVRAEVDAAIDIKVNEGNKKAKDKNASTEPAKYDESFLNEALCVSLSPELARKCIAIKILLDTTCVRYGYVLDVWGYGNDILLGHAGLSEIFKSVLARPVAVAAVEGAEGAESSTEGSGEAQQIKDSQSKALSKLLREKVELIVELQGPDNIPVERLLASQGAAAKAKESQAAVKLLESQIAAYRGQIVSLKDAEGADNGVSSHKGVVEIGEALGGFVEVLRIDCMDSSPEALAAAVTKRMFEKHNGAIGWLPSRPQIVPADAFDHNRPQEALPSTVDNNVPPASPRDKQDGGDEVAISTGTVVQVEESRTAWYDKLSQNDKEKLSEKSQKAQQFLVNTVLPQITAAMVQIHRERPPDPIKFLADYLKEQSDQMLEEEREAAKEQFYLFLQNGKAVFNSM